MHLLFDPEKHKKNLIPNLFILTIAITTGNVSLQNVINTRGTNQLPNNINYQEN